MLCAMLVQATSWHIWGDMIVDFVFRVEELKWGAAVAFNPWLSLEQQLSDPRNKSKAIHPMSYIYIYISAQDSHLISPTVWCSQEQLVNSQSVSTADLRCSSSAELASARGIVQLPGPGKPSGQMGRTTAQRSMSPPPNLLAMDAQCSRSPTCL